MIKQISTKLSSNLAVQEEDYEIRLHRTFNYCFTYGVIFGGVIGLLFFENVVIGFILGGTVSIILPSVIESFRHIYSVFKK